MSGWTPGYVLINAGLLLASPILIGCYALHLAYKGAASGVNYLYSKYYNEEPKNQETKPSVTAQGLFRPKDETGTTEQMQASASPLALI